MGPGVHSIAASYSGDPIFPASSSNAVSVTIDELRILRIGNNNSTILPGTTVVYTLQVEPQVATTFLYNVSFTASGLPAGAAATFSPASLASGTNTTNLAMTVVTAGTALNGLPFRGCRSPWDFCFPSSLHEECESGCGRFTNFSQWRCLRRSAWRPLRD